MFERFTQSARATVQDALYEANQRGDRRIGTDHLLLAVLSDDDMARLIGADAAVAHNAIDQLDRSALAAVGLSLTDLTSTTRSAPIRNSAAMTAGAKTVLKRSLANAAAEKAKAITSRHILLALLERREPDPAAQLFAALPIDREALERRLSDAA